MKKKYLTNSSSQTKKLGEVLAKKAIRVNPCLPRRESKTLLRGSNSRKFVLILGLEGDLGGGKTTFLKGFAKGLGIKEKILSPTFVILKRFKIKDLRFKNFYHVDCYRIKKSKEILDLGFKEIISNPKNIVVVEWADRIRKIMPKDTIWILFELINKKKRKIILKSNVQHATLNI